MKLKGLVVSAGKDLVIMMKLQQFSGLELSFCERLSSMDRMLREERPFFVLLDTSVHRLAMLEFCQSFTNEQDNQHVPVLVVGSSSTKDEELEAFQAGASDYIARPLDPAVLLMRILARTSFARTKPIVKTVEEKCDRLVIDQEGYAVFLDGKVLTLSRKEFELLKLLKSKPGKVFSREEIFDKVWKRAADESDRTIDVHILRLRKKLGNGFIGTQKGIGYRFVM